MPITPLPTPPRRDDPANFSERADAFLGALPLFVTQANATAAAADAAASTAINAPGTQASSTTSLLISTGTKSLTVQTGKAFAIGQSVMIAQTSAPTNYMHGQITAYNTSTGALTVAVDATGGGGTVAAWTISLSLPQIALALSGNAEVTGPVRFAGAVDLGAGVLLSGNGATVTFNSGGPRLAAISANRLGFYTDSTANARIELQQSGQVNVGGARGIGQNANVQGSGNLKVIAASVGGYAISTYDTQDYVALQFVRDNGGAQQIGTITVSQSSVSYNTASDYRLKENVAPLHGALDRVLSVTAHRFNFTVDPTRTVDGFLAHEVAAAVPEAVTGTKDAVDTDGHPAYQSIDQSKLVPLLWAAVQELAAEVALLKAGRQ